MIVYCDTSFLVSYLNEDDVNHQSAKADAGKLDAHDFVICEVHLLELSAALRAATHRTTIRIPSPFRVQEILISHLRERHRISSELRGSRSLQPPALVWWMSDWRAATTRRCQQEQPSSIAWSPICHAIS